MERFELIDNQFIKKVNVVSALPGNTLPGSITDLLNDWCSEKIKNENGKYHEKSGGKEWQKCSIANHYLRKYYCDYIKPSNKYDFLQLIADFLNVGDVLYALTIADIILRIARKALSIAKDDDVKTINGFISSLDELRYKIEHDADLFQNVKRNENKDLEDKLDNVRKPINKELIYKIDGATALAKEIGDDTFIQYAIDQCYFFNQKVVKARMDEIVEAFQSNPQKDLYARRSAKISTDDDKEIDYEDKGESGNDSYDQEFDSTRATAGAVAAKIKTVSLPLKAVVEALRSAIYQANRVAKNVQIATIIRDEAKTAVEDAVQKVEEAATIENAVKLADDVNKAVNAAEKVAAEVEGIIRKAEDEIKKKGVADQEIKKKITEAVEKAKNASNKTREKSNEVKNAIKALNNVSTEIGNFTDKQKKDSKFYLFTSKEKGKEIDNYPILLDNDGNAEVRSVITEKTGYTVSAGKENIFQNYKISHVWGRAFDPRYFTNLWNIVIVPSWANDLLDKPNARPGTLESKLQSTIMRICEALYFDGIEERDWNTLKLSNKPSVINGGKDVVKPSNEVKGIKPYKTIPNKEAQENDVPYMINVIKGKKSDKKRDNELGDIVKYAVYI